MVVGFRYATPFHYHDNAGLHTNVYKGKDLKKSVNACWVDSVESVYKMHLFLPVTFLISLQYMSHYVCNRTVQVYVIERPYLYLIFIKSEVSNVLIGVVSGVVWLRWSCQLCQIHPGKAGGRLNKKDGLTRYGDSHVKDKTS